ncbi:MAG TPA: ABC transporter permease [Chloroflexota bacterium]|jgi:tungstate transport system permease protein|nr:ABC transporter permease [Chloroflexota bacterium]
MDLIGQGLVEALRLLVSGDPELVRISTLSLVVSISAALIAALIGIPTGVVLALARFPGRGVINVLVNTGMGLPPVLVGLCISVLLWRSGPLGFLQLLYTPAAMVIAQFVVAVPIVIGLTRAAVGVLNPELAESLRVCGARNHQVAYQLIRAAHRPVAVAVVAGFGRAIGEVGASLMVGGSILGQTRILTTAITLETSRGDFALAIALGGVLLVLALLVNMIVSVGAHRTIANAG